MGTVDPRHEHTSPTDEEYPAPQAKANARLIEFWKFCVSACGIAVIVLAIAWSCWTLSGLIGEMTR